MDGATAKEVTEALQDRVRRGTAKGISEVLSGTGWSIEEKPAPGAELELP